MDGRKRMESQMAEKLETTKLGKVINIQTNSIYTWIVNKYLDFFHYLKNMKVFRIYKFAIARLWHLREAMFLDGY